MKTILWINDNTISKESLENMHDDGFEVLPPLNSNWFRNANQKEAGTKQVQAMLQRGSTCILTDSKIFDNPNGGFTLLETFQDHDNFDCGVVISEALHPAPDDPKWHACRSKIWRFQAESTAPDADTCKQILRFFRDGTTSFINPASEMLKQFATAFCFVKELTADECAHFLENWGSFRSLLGVSGDSLIPFCPRQAKRRRLFPKTFPDLENALGFPVSRKQRKQNDYPLGMVDWRQILCPFESLLRATTWCSASNKRQALTQQPGTFGGALRLLCESARKASGKNDKLQAPEELLLESDSVQRDWILAQYERLDTKIQRFELSEYRDLLNAASSEVQRALAILQRYKEEVT